jgi:transposase-like protein
MSERRIYSLEFKAKIILKYRSLQNLEKKEEKSINKISSVTGIDRRIISQWVNKNADRILEGLCLVLF